MIFTTPMRLIAAVVLEEASEEVSKELLRQGALDLVSVQELSGEWKNRVEPVPPNVSLARLEELRKRIEGFAQISQPPLRMPEPSLDKLTPLNLDAAERTLNGISSEVNAIRDRQKNTQEDILRLQEMQRQIELFDDLRMPTGRNSSYSFLTVRTGSLPSPNLPGLEKALEGIPSVLVPSQTKTGPSSGAILVTLKRDDAKILPLIQQSGWEEVALPEEEKGGKDQAIQELRSKTEALRTRQTEYTEELHALFTRKAAELSGLWSELRAHELLARLQSGFSRTSRTILFSGWIPQELQKDVEAGILRAAKGQCYLEWISPSEGDAKELKAPVSMKNPKALKPFEMLVRNYGVPEYGTVDPTPFVSVAYLIMFGLMFGDAGHGLVLVIIGLLGVLSARKKGKNGDLFRLIVYCGGAAIVMGILFGSYFGNAWFPPLWFDYHGIISGHAEHPGGVVQNIYDILGITIRFGIAVISLGLVLNWVNLIRKREWLPLILDKGGILGGWIYAGGVWMAYYYVGSHYKELPAANLLFWILGIPTLALALKAPLEYARQDPKKRKKFGLSLLMKFFMDWFVEILEVYSGYLANTLSFMRVAGLGIAHVSLMIAFAQIARMITPTGPLSIWAILILIFGNALVIVLEGLSAGIQALRLNYYEFFSKYFTGTGRAYKPISLRGKE